jgi:hypothetical protein
MLSNALACGSLTHTHILSRVRKAALVNTFAPRGAVRCLGDAVFRTKAAHDAACLWDLDGSVIGRRCLPEVIVRNKQHHVPDFAIERVSGITFVDASPSTVPLLQNGLQTRPRRVAADTRPSWRPRSMKTVAWKC